MLVASFAGIRRHVIMLNGTFPFFDIKGCSVSTDTIFSGTETDDRQEKQPGIFLLRKRDPPPLQAPVGASRSPMGRSQLYTDRRMSCLRKKHPALAASRSLKSSPWPTGLAPELCLNLG